MIDLASVACHAAITLDIVCKELSRGTVLYQPDSIKALAQDIRERPLAQEPDPTNLLMYRNAIDSKRDIKHINELRLKLTLLAKDLETYQTCAPDQQAVLRDTALAISHAAMVYEPLRIKHRLAG